MKGKHFNFVSPIDCVGMVKMLSKRIGGYTFVERVESQHGVSVVITVKNLKFGTPQTIAIIVLHIETFDVTLH